jgi:hypothetical protein
MNIELNHALMFLIVSKYEGKKYILQIDSQGYIKINY